MDRATAASEVDSPLIAPDLALDRLHLIVPDGSDAMVVLEAWAHGSQPGADPRSVFAERIGEVGHVSVSFGDEDPPQLRLDLPDLVLQCVAQPGPDGTREHLGLRVISIRPTGGQPEGAKLLTITTREPVVTEANGVASDTFRLLDWRVSTQHAARSEQLYATLKLVDSLERAEKQRAQSQRTRFTGAREYWRCKSCRALWRPESHERCPSCGREFTDADRRSPEIGKVEFQIPVGEPINLTADAAVLIEPDDETNFVGRVARIDHQRHVVEIVTRTFEHSGSEGYIAPSFNKALYQAKRSVLAAIATKDFGVGLLAQLLVSPETIIAPKDESDAESSWLTSGMRPNKPQNRAVGLLSRLSAGQAVFIQGPPGTGKTTVIVEAVKRRLAANPDERILVTSHSNLAVDNALERLAGTPGMRAVRVARAERVHPAVDKFRCDDEDDPRLLEANCYFATCATAATSGITDMNFDIVILDEANKARADEALPALRLGRSLALVGDHKQLPPVEDDALYGIVEIDPALEDLVNRSLFEQCWDGGLPAEAQCLLTIQHRMHPDIAAYVSAASYDNQLENAPEVEAYDYITRKPFPVALHFVDTEGMRGGRERRGPGGALRNEAEVRVAAQVVRLLDERAPRELSMAVIAMYAEQVERLRQALGRRKFKRTVKIDTVDSFEGREEDIVVISLVRSNERGRIGFLRVPNRLNVAISRAKRLVACIGDSATLRSGDESMYGALVEASRSTGGWLSALELVSQPKPNRGAPRQQQDGASVESGEGTETERAAKRRRRRRRGRRGAPQPAVASTDGSTPVVTQPQAGEGQPQDGTLRKRRRRRRRGRGRGAGTGQPTGQVTDGGRPAPPTEPQPDVAPATAGDTPEG
ncbi:MAG TPA: AAA domain-containing protein [Candidatus Acidoferrales bacterium]|nr:AAA domain-containing protein [Candidatus Acidoferrales bacterium]